MVRRLLVQIFFAFVLMSAVSAQTISFTSIPDGYEAGNIDLGKGFTGALAADPTNDNIIYASVGYWQHNSIVRIDLATKLVMTVADGYFGSIGGMAVPGSNRLIVVDNDDCTSNSIPGDTVLLLTDINIDGDFNDAGEIAELIAPILVDGGSFTGAQARIAPAGSPSMIPTGSLLFQNADGNGHADLFVVTNPTSSTTAAYRPADDAYFTGFDYNGGFDFDSHGNIFMGTTDSFFSGEVYALVNTNHDEDIDAGEWNDIVTSASLPGGISDFVIDAEDDAFIITNPWGGSQVQTFRIPSDPLYTKATPMPFANTDSSWLTSIIINTKSRHFGPGAPNGATMLVGGYSGMSSATNLLTLRPRRTLEAKFWQLY